MAANISDGNRTVSHKEPVAEIAHIVKHDDVTTTVLKVDELPSSSLYPAGLYDQANPAIEVLQLHKLVNAKGDILTFESYCVESSPASVGERFVFRCWWTSDALDLVLNTDLVWSQEKYPDDQGHWYCPLTYETIGSDEGQAEGYRSGDTWVTVEAYEKFIRDDVLRIRGGRRAR